MGSIFRVPVISCTVGDVLNLEGYTKAVTMLDGAVDIFKADFFRQNRPRYRQRGIRVCDEIKNTPTCP